MLRFTGALSQGSDYNNETIMHTMSHMLIATFAVILLFAPVGVSLAQKKPAQPVLKVAVMADGHITVNGKPAKMESLRESLKKLSQQKGVVWYYREAAKSEPPPEAQQVIQAVIDARLPIRLSSRPDYSDAIGIDGKPIKQ